jgi:putative nucleotidyltransferase with HDIG domain
MSDYTGQDAGAPPSALLAQADCVEALPTLSYVVDQAIRLTDDDDAGAAQIADLICSDPSISVQVLRLANSAAFGLLHRVTSIQQAVSLLGFNVLKGILIGAAVFDKMQGTMSDVWAHSLGCATVAAMIGRKAMYHAPEELYTAGLLHDIGKVFWATQCPESLQKILALTAERDLTMAEAEEELLGVTHAQIGRRMAVAWGLPEALAEPVGHHHSPQSAASCSSAAFAIHLADCLVRAHGLDDGCSDLVPSLHPVTLQAAGLTRHELRDIIDSLDIALAGTRRATAMAA